MNSALEILFAGAELLLDASGALYWPKEKLLVVSDLHFEKASFLAQHGSLIAPYDTIDTLERLDALISHYTPRELLFLGDSFHDRNAWHRLDTMLHQRLAAVIGRVAQCRWIEGNHDVSLSGHGLPLFEAQHTRHGIIFSHEYEHSPLPHIIGHYHPKTRFSFNGQTVRGRCFVHSTTLLVMPAFGSFTGGLEIQEPVFKALFKNSADVHTFFTYKRSIHKLAVGLK